VSLKKKGASLLYSLLITSRKLCHYFGKHKIIVVTDFPLGDIL
jgi:hypothetical protein